MTEVLQTKNISWKDTNVKEFLKNSLDSQKVPKCQGILKEFLKYQGIPKEFLRSPQDWKYITILVKLLQLWLNILQPCQKPRGK